ncbi:MAG: peptidoglycan DD-metalloendopeptidase family protein [Alistipes sp.]|jgi:septal ring factor EnvC (AmiA/AmiB activator)|nr:peptidoglycan DD-metalloendopeptidase family protein [Alistipes sp.]
MKKSLRIVFGMAALVGASLVGLSQQRDIEAQNAVKRRSEERLAEIERLNRTIEGNISRSESDLRIARSTIGAKREIASDLDREWRRVTTEMNADTRETRRLENTLEELKKSYGRAVYSAWKNHKTGTATTLLLASRDFNDAVRRMSLIRRYNLARRQKGEMVDSLARTLSSEIERLGTKQVELAGLRRESDALLVSLARDEARYEAALKTLGTDRTRLAAEARAEREKIAAAQREIDGIMERQARAARATALTEADIVLSGRFGENKGRLPWPTGAPGLILHHFGKERSSDGIESDFKGMIIAARRGSEVKAVFEGTVTLISDLGQFDKCVMVRSGDYVVGYGNIAAPAVKSGDRVTLGQSLGRITSSDNPDRHLVMVWMQQGSTVLDPEQWLRK